MLTVWEQNEWRGIARDGVVRRDPFTSKLEVNTVPGEDRIERIGARKDYTGFLGAPAVFFSDKGPYFKLYDKNGDTPDFGKTGENFEACVCFRPPDPSETWLRSGHAAVTSFGATTDSRASPTGDCAWRFFLYNNGDGYWQARSEIRFTGTAGYVFSWASALSHNSWYWAELVAGESVTTFRVFENGSTTASYTAPQPLDRDSVAGTFPLVVGSEANGREAASGVAISYAAVGTTVPTPWIAEMPFDGGGLEAAFMPYNPRHQVQPAVAEDSTNKYTWVQLPRVGIRKTSTATPFAATGIRGEAGVGYHADLSDRVLFDDLTVFLLCFEPASTSWALLRSNDGIFDFSSRRMEGYASTQAYTWLCPADPSQSEGNNYGCLKRVWWDSEIQPGTVSWVALEVSPDFGTAADSFCGYLWQSGTWEIAASSGPLHGLADCDLSQLVLCESPHEPVDLYDFRVSVGDSGWKTTHTPTSMMASMPDTIVAWLNHDESGRWPRDENIASKKMPQDAHVTPRTVALSDRIDGKFRYTRDQVRPRLGWASCPYLGNAFLPRVEDIFVGRDGTVSGATDAYYFSGSTTRPQYQLDTLGRARVAPVGEHRYITGASPLHVVTTRPNALGFQRCFILCDYDDTYDFEGFLDWSTTYSIRCTLYDPITDTESNPFGPYRFTSDTAPGDTTAPYGDTGCAVTLGFKVWHSQRIVGKQLRVYRLHVGSGTYFFEGSCTLGEWEYQASLSDLEGMVVTGTFTCSLSENDLQASIPLEYDNNTPPEHICATIWAGRAFYVPAVYPSRLVFSKMSRPGCCPGANLLWTDEGLTGDILGLIPGLGGLILLRERSIWIVPQFSDATSAYAQPLVPDIGCVSGSSAVFADGVLWWASPGGICSYDGTSLPNNHSKRLGGLDRKVWRDNPSACYAYYDRQNWRVVFCCDGRGVAVDTRSGAATLCAAPENCATDVLTSTASGVLFGADGAGFIETAGNKSLTLSTAETLGPNDSGPATATALVALTWYWSDGDSAGSLVLGYEVPDLEPTAYGFLSATSDVGRALFMVSDDWTEIWARQIHSVGLTSSATSYALLRSGQGLLDHYSVDRVPMRYESQDLYLGHWQDPRIFERLDFATGELEATATADVALYALSPGSTTELVATATGGLSNENAFLLPARIRGTQCRYVLESWTPDDFPEVTSVRLHYQQIRPRGRAR